jgi:hypothetical protein
MTQNPTRGRVVAIVTGGVILSLATLALAGGAFFHWLEDKKDSDGYYTTSSERFATDTYAIATENLDIAGGWPGGQGHYGDVRLKVRSDGGKPVFVGVARTSAVDSYLAASARATVTDIDVDPFRADYSTSGGSKRPAAPATQDIWAASATGTGTQALNWDVEDGDWSVVVMNADGSAGVDADVSVGADVPIVDDLADGFMIGGLGLLVIGGAILAAGMFMPPRRRSWPAGSASAA